MNAFDEVAFSAVRDPPSGLTRFILVGVAVASVSCVFAFALRSRLSPPVPAAVTIAPTDPTTKPEPAPQLSGADFGPMIVEPGWLSAAKTNPEDAAVTTPEAVPPPSANNAQAEPTILPTVTARLPDVVPMPPTREVPEVADTFPMPPPRPSELTAPMISAPEGRVPQSRVASAPGPADAGNVFQRLFGSLNRWQEPGVAPPTATGAIAPTVAVGAPPAAAPPPAAAAARLEARSGGRSAGPSPLAFFSQKLFGASRSPAGYDRYTAVYDIAARTVYMPDGSHIEAHSGLGDRLDNPRYVSERAKGATPPHLYDLTMRESLFHGVQALRLNPVGEGSVYGRDGFLAHPYMLGPNGDSNGCLSVREYDAFLRAYQNGQIKHLAVVAGL